MNRELLEILRKVTPEEQQILDGKNQIERALYTAANDTSVEKNGQGLTRIDAAKLMERGKMIAVRTHTRFIHFPRHTHNYVEVIYMCSGTTHHRINEQDVILREGELLFLNQSSVQEIYPAGMDDIAVNFIILPEFFDYALKMTDNDSNQLREFVLDGLRGGKDASSFLHFKVAGILPVQNLVENLIWTIVTRQPNRRSIQQATMGLLLIQLMNYMDLVDTDKNSGQQKMIMDVLSYIEGHYRDGSLQEMAEQMHYDFSWLSKEIRKRTGKTYTDLVQQKRLNQAAYLLTTSTMNVMDVALAVGYDNISYFHRIFQKQYGMTPRNYRLEHRKQNG